MAGKKDDDKIETFLNLSLISQICILKCLAYRGLSDLTNCRLWAQVLPQHFTHFQAELYKYGENFEKEMFQPLLKNNLTMAIHANLALVQTVCEPKQRNLDCFRWLYIELMHELVANGPSPAYYIGCAIKEHSIDIEDVLPFLQFFTKYCTSTPAIEHYYTLKLKFGPNNPRMSVVLMELQQAKDGIIKLKNSLLINAHFENYHRRNE